MIVSLPYRFLFVANLRSGSTSLQQALRPVGTICLDATPAGKHLSLREIHERLGPDAVAPLYKWGVIRDPVAYLWSLYGFHKRPEFDDLHSTRSLRFEEFYCDAPFAWMRVPQSTRFVDAAGDYAMDLVLRFEHLRPGFGYLKFRLGLPNLLLPWVNTSEPAPPRIGDDMIRRIRDDYAADYELIARYADRERTREGFVPILRPAPLREAAARARSW